MPKKLTLTKDAQHDAIRLDLPYAAYKAFTEQASNARQRKIPFLFTLSDWWDWWQTDGRWERRGIGAEKLVL